MKSFATPEIFILRTSLDLRMHGKLKVNHVTGNTQSHQMRNSFAKDIIAMS